MNLVELERSIRNLRLSGMADVLETGLHQAQSDKLAPIDLVSALVLDELLRRQDRLFVRRTTQARFRDVGNLARFPLDLPASTYCRGTGQPEVVSYDPLKAELGWSPQVATRHPRARRTCRSP